jgi:hypothetical protein
MIIPAKNKGPAGLGFLIPNFEPWARFARFREDFAFGSRVQNLWFAFARLTSAGSVIIHFQ